MRKLVLNKPAATFTTVFIVFLTMLNIASCRKADFTANPETKNVKSKEEKFFTAYSSSNFAVKRAQSFFITQNDKYQFAEKFIKRIGMPRWNKALVYSSGSSAVSTESTGGGSPATIVYIPFVRDSQNFVNATIIVKMTATDTVYQVVCNWQYSNFGFVNSDTSWSARDIFTIFSKLDKSVFGHRLYNVHDGRIFGYPQETPLIVSVEEDMGTESFELQCKTSRTCVTAPPSTNRIATETVCVSNVVCTLVWVDPPPESGGGGGGGGGGGEPPGGGGGGPDVPPPTCNDPSCEGEPWTPTPPGNPCDALDSR